jgi:hypothetical protein
MTQYYACSKRFEDGYDCWGIGASREEARFEAEDRLLNTYGSRSPKYFAAMNTMTTMTMEEAVENNVDVGRVR